MNWQKEKSRIPLRSLIYFGLSEIKQIVQKIGKPVIHFKVVIEMVQRRLGI
ncbi:MAG: hypothetical protein QGG23_06415 [Candidatus Bathyarchaeota archaeon]|nr:hypothetical protein [Candidatus Bathyarchaeota archaeon]